MIYLVSKKQELFNSSKYDRIDFQTALKLLNNLKLIQLDSETSGLDCHTKALLTLQLGNKDNQVVFDWNTLTQIEKKQIKDLLEDPDKVYLGWNLS